MEMRANENLENADFAALQSSRSNGRLPSTSHPLCQDMSSGFGRNVSGHVNVRGHLRHAPSSDDVPGDGPDLP